MTKSALGLIAQAAHRYGHISGNGLFTKKCEFWIEKNLRTKKALLTHSCTAALEMAAILLDLKRGDEVILPSFTFVSTANAFVLRGATPVFVDIRPDTLNLDENKIERAITKKTRAIVPVHYAGVGCEMNAIMGLARRHRLSVVEDAAQGILSAYNKKPLGSMGDLSVLSFHETKPIISGEGGALLVNDTRFIKRAEIIREKGTNRSEFFRGQVDKYTWLEIGSSYLPSELVAAFLWSQFEEASEILRHRLKIWAQYHRAFEKLEYRGKLRRPTVPPGQTHNGHIYHLIFPNAKKRDKTLYQLNRAGINATFHYIPLHLSPAGRRFGRASGRLTVTERVSHCLLRLPLWLGVEKYVPQIVRHIEKAIE